MADSPGNPGNAGKPPNDGAVRNVGRRRLLRAGISTAPVVMTVLSRPVLAANGICQSPSGFTSGNVSNMGMGPGCTGKSISYWRDNPSLWPAPYIPTDVIGTPVSSTGGKKDKKDKKGTGTGGTVATVHATLFVGVFSPDLNPADSTFLDVLMNLQMSPDIGQRYVARLCVATVLNIAAGFVPSTVLTTITVQHIWKEYATNNYGFFHPGTINGAKWNEAEIIDYLLTTMPG